MRRITWAASLAVLTPLLIGCGGQLGRNSPVQVEMESSTNTVNLTNLHIIVSPNNGSANSAAAASDVQGQSWATLHTTSTLKELDFTTTSQQVPYFVYIQNTSGVQEEVRLTIMMDGNSKFNQVLTIAANSTIQEENILRNNVQGP